MKINLTLCFQKPTEVVITPLTHQSYQNHRFSKIEIDHLILYSHYRTFVVNGLGIYSPSWFNSNKQLSNKAYTFET
jgi:hypothetical protein